DRLEKLVDKVSLPASELRLRKFSSHRFRTTYNKYYIDDFLHFMVEFVSLLIFANIIKEMMS
ncbi:MAG: hypothetical protein UE068_06250, partial [Paludibacteraceae bacterium]|nr:hypothetical protein [Paludibacteraceae bacterium]